ncbi:gap junction beta-1 protein [Brachyhypopomus gauderio]|uniref:gap junction beta-1 protein n=1 Tax=Brachyhypopomus gauderio TaxID=698409 RepID=UPI0040437737
MAAIVTGLIPILRTAVDTTTTYKGRMVWFGFLCIRLVTLFVAEMPWFKLDSDFSCNDTSDSLCTRACFNRHFDRSSVMTWNFLFVLLILSVLLMELFTAHMRAVFQKRSTREKSGGEAEAQGDVKGSSGFAPDPAGLMALDMHKSRKTVLFYLLSVVLRIAVEVWFVHVLLNWNLPKLEERIFQCKVETCPKHFCLVRAAAEKRMSIYALLSISGMVIFISSVFCLYVIAHYFCNFWTQRSQNV